MDWPIPEPQSFLSSTVHPILCQPLAWPEWLEETPLKRLEEAQHSREKDWEGQIPHAGTILFNSAPPKLHYWVHTGQ